MNHLFDHIDAPMRKCVAGLNLLGIKTGMSCCGFSYKDEAVPKTHLQKAYIYIDKSSLDSYSKSLLFDIAVESRWTLAFPGEWIDFYGDTWTKNHPWANKDAVHYYEVFILAINALEKTLTSKAACFNDIVTIEDGNKWYKDKYTIKYWQYEPTESWVVTPEIYHSL